MTTKQTTIDDVLRAVTGVGQKVDGLAVKVEAIDQRVTALEQQPMLKARLMGTNGHGAPVPAPVGNREDQRPSPIVEPTGRYHRGVCSRIGITKTKMTGRWKLNCYIRGSMGRPASAYSARNGDCANLVETFSEVWPEISDDHFSDDEFYTRDAETKKKTGGKGFYEAKFRVPPFTVEWHESEPDGNGKTWAYVDDVYPVGEG